MRFFIYLLIGSIALLIVPLIDDWLHLAYFSYTYGGDWAFYAPGYIFWYGTLAILALMVAPRFTMPILFLLAWGWVVGDTLLFTTCQQYLDIRLGLPMGEPFLSLAAAKAILYNGLHTTVFNFAFRLLYLWRRKRKATIHDPGANP